MTTAGVWVVVLAGGGGNRFGGLKQFALLGGTTLLDRVIQVAGQVGDGVVVVLPGGDGPGVFLDVRVITAAEAGPGPNRCAAGWRPFRRASTWS